MSLALAHKRRTIALGGAAITAAAVSAALPYSPAEALSSPANARKHLLLQEAALDQDLARISAINGLAGRQALKREELLPKYQEYVQRYCESGLNFPNRPKHVWPEIAVIVRSLSSTSEGEGLAWESSGENIDFSLPLMEVCFGNVFITF